MTLNNSSLLTGALISRLQRLYYTLERSHCTDNRLDVTPFDLFTASLSRE